MKLTKNDPRVAALQQYCREKGASALVLAKVPNLCWLLGGRPQVGVAGDTGVCRVVVNPDSVTLLTSNIEGERLRQEEFGNEIPIIVTPWADASAAAAAERSLVGNAPLYDAACEKDLLNLRTLLLPRQEQEAREIGRLCGDVMTKACWEICPGMSEWEISGVAAKYAFSAGLTPIVLFSACDDRIRRYRHAVNREENRLVKIVMLSMGSQKNGMYGSVTRFVCFGEPDEQTLIAQDAACRVMAALYAATRPGTSFEELYRVANQVYGAVGFPGEILLHHQGGLAGFQTREEKINPDSKSTVKLHQLYAWNPSVTGFKCEDTVLTCEDGIEVLTGTDAFPHKTYTAGGREYRLPQMLIR